METCFKPGNLTCLEVRELLSDLIDARRGEIPHPDGTQLAQPGMRAAAELHLASCQSCRESLSTLEAVGAVYAEYSVGELPPQFFHDFGQKARARVREIECHERIANLTCSDVQARLSDLLDFRRGEALANPEEAGLFLAIDAHVDQCETCRDELIQLEEVGLAFAEYSVDEAPEKQFARYANIVRARAGKLEPVQVNFQYRPFWRRNWTAVAAAGLVASLVLAGMRQFKPAKDVVASNTADDTRTAPTFAGLVDSPKQHKTPRRTPAPRVPIPMEVLIPAQQAHMAYKDVREASLAQLPPEGQVGYFVMGERSLLGAYLKTTRDSDPVEGTEPLGLMVYDVVPNSPANAMGLQKNDYIVSINDIDINHGSAQDALKFLALLQEKGVGAPVSLQVVRKEGAHWCFLKPLEGVLGEVDPMLLMPRSNVNF